MVRLIIASATVAMLFGSYMYATDYVEEYNRDVRRRLKQEEVRECLTNSLDTLGDAAINTRYLGESYFASAAACTISAFIFTNPTHATHLISELKPSHVPVIFAGLTVYFLVKLCILEQMIFKKMQKVGKALVSQLTSLRHS